MGAGLQEGDAFWRWTDEEPEPHLHFIIKRLLNGSYITANFTSVPQGRPYDETCVLGPEDEPWLRKRSYVLYKKCRHVSADTLGIWTRGELRVLKPDNLARITQGALESSQTPRWIKQRLRHG